MTNNFHKTAKELITVLNVSGLSKTKFGEKIGKSRQTINNWIDNGGVTYDNWQLIVTNILNDSANDSVDFVKEDQPNYNAKPFKSPDIVIPKIQGNVIYVPHDAYAGFASGNNNPLKNEDLEVWTLPFLRYMAYCFQVNGDSMYRTLRDGEKVFVEQQSLRDLSEFRNKIHVIETKDGDYLIKRVSRINKEEIRIHSDNPDHKDKQEIYNLEQDISRIWKVKDALKWDLGFMEDMEGIDTGMEDAALKLDKL